MEDQLERRFELNADELRKVDAELKELRTDLDRNVQLMEKQKIMTNQYEGIKEDIQRRCCLRS